MSAGTAGRVAAAGSTAARCSARVDGIAPSSATAPAGAVSLGALLARADAAVRAGLPEPVWTVATVVAIKAARGGWSLELVDADTPNAAQLRAYLPDGVLTAMGRSSGRAVDAALLIGLTIVLRIGLDLHPRWGVSGRVAALAPGTDASLAARAVEAARARLAAQDLLDKQRRLPVPRDVTRIAIVHPPDAASWADVRGELEGWAASGVIAVHSVPVRFEGEGASAGLASAVARAAAGAIAGAQPDLVLLVRGGGARAGLAPLDGEDLARAIALSPAPVVTGLGHASDTGLLADAVAWRAADTPSKALGVVRELIARPARRAAADYAMTLAAVLSALDRAAPTLDAAMARAAAAAQGRAADASGRLGAAWAGAVGEARAARESLGRRGDGLDALAAAVAGAASTHVDRCRAVLDAQIRAARERGRAALAGVADGGRLVAAVTALASARLDAADAALGAACREVALAGRVRADRHAADLGVLGEAVRARARDRVERADDGSRLLAAVADAAMAVGVGQAGECRHLIDAVEIAAARRLDMAAAALAGAQAVLDGADPSRVLARGYALVIDGTDRPLTSARAAGAEPSLTLRFADGDVPVCVTSHLPTRSFP